PTPTPTPVPTSTPTPMPTSTPIPTPTRTPTPEIIAEMTSVLVENRVADPEKVAKVVQVTRQGTPVAAELQMPLQAGDTITTQADSTAAITYRKGHTVVLGPAETDGEIRKQGMLGRIGRIFVKAQGAFQVETDYIAAGTEGTEFVVDLGADTAVAVSVLNGKILVRSQKNLWEPVRLDRLEQATTSGAEAPTVAPIEQQKFNTTIEWVNQTEKLAKIEERVLVPKVEGLPIEQAQEILSQAGLKVNVREVIENKAQGGTVLRQNLLPGSRAEVESVLELVVEKTLRLSLFLPESEAYFWTNTREGAESEARKLGVELLLVTTEWGDQASEAQAQDLRKVIRQNVDGIAVVPFSDGIIPEIVRAAQRDIPVVTLFNSFHLDDLKEQGAVVYAFVAESFFLDGQQVAEFISQQLGAAGGEVAVLEGVPGQIESDEQRDGFFAVIEQVPALKVVTSEAAYWDYEQAVEVTAKMLQAYPNLKAIYACNDPMAMGALQAIHDAGKSGEIIVVGSNGDDFAIAAILEGHLTATIAMNSFGIGEMGVRRLVEIIRNREAPPEETSRVNVPSRLITRDLLEKQATP
ncbi:substrate-binding domain-containing protein, partial [candidate division KSB3 bacterium]|nr:substrate-binding domain-containing protein [candidate division KSB3 bacterium]MBD3327529.1 substrate-binding domain-containing protein [candidate division KSB3 bacterium]